MIFNVDWQSSETINNFITYFGLHCITKLEIGLMGTSMFVGYTASSIVLPRLADIYGRKVIFRGFFIMHSLGVGLIMFIPNYIAIYFGLFLVGSASTLRSAIGYVYSLEFIETSKQNIASSIMKTIDVTIPIWLSLLYMYTSNEWRHYYLASFVIGLMVWASSFLIPESPGFLIAQNRFDEAKNVISQISRVNGKKAPHIIGKQYMFQQEIEILNSSKFDEDNNNNEALKKEAEKALQKSISQHLKNPRTFRNIIILSGSWLTATFSYYMINFYIKYLPGSIYYNTIFCGIADTIGYFLTGILFQYVGAKASL